MASMMFCGDGAIFLVSFLLQLLLLLLSNYSTAAGCSEKERHVLLELKAGLVADECSSSLLPSWNHNNTDECCQWERVTCNKQTGHVEMLDLNGFDQLHPFRGEISASLMELHHLQYLNLSLNWFLNSPVPEFISSLSNLRILDLQSSYFGGRIPSGLATLSRLQYLDLSRNKLQGTIPHKLGNLSRLQYLDLSYNNLVGTIPHQLGCLSNLHELYLGFNQGGLKIDDKGGSFCLSIP